MLAVTHNADPQVISLLLEHGTEVNETNDSGKSALILAGACSFSHDVVSTLLSHGADIGTIDNEGNSAVVAAACFNKNKTPEILAVLLKADVPRSNDGIRKNWKCVGAGVRNVSWKEN
jgi:ankyrin repeat protein